MERITRRGAVAAVAALLALSPIAPAVARPGRPVAEKPAASEDGLRLEVDRPVVMLGDEVEVEARFKVELPERSDTDDAEETDDDVAAAGAGALLAGATLPGAVAFTVDHGDGSPIAALAVEELEVDDEELEAKATGTHLYAAEGTYTVTVTATPDVGAAEVAEVVVEVTTEPVPYPRRGRDACPETGIPASTFADLPAASKHKRSVDCASAWGLVAGKTPESFAPGQEVSREQLATLLVRMVERAGVALPDGGDLFVDDERSLHEASINKLAAAGLVSGTGADRFSPSAPVSRAQMASLLVRVYDHLSEHELTALVDYFADDDGNVHQGNINLSAAAGFTSGKALGSYAPGGHVTREQIATFLVRTLDRLVALDGLTF